MAQEILLLARNIYKAYQKASFDLKRKYLSFFSERFAAFYREQKEEKPKEIAYTNTGITNLFGSAYENWSGTP